MIKLWALEWFIALRYLGSRRREGFISVISLFSFLGILLGVATLIVVMSVMNGFRQDLFERILGVKGHGEIIATEESFDNYALIQNRLQSLPFIKSVLPVVEGQVLFSTKNGALGGVLRGMRAEDLAVRPVIEKSLSRETIAAFETNEGILVGARMAAEFRLRQGSTITLFAPQGRYTAFGIVPRSKSFKVAGIFTTDMYEYDRFLAFLPLSQAQLFFGHPEKIHKLEIDVTQPDDIDLFAHTIRSVLPPGFFLQSWKDVNGSFYEALAVERRVMFLILSLIILVAAFNVISGQIMLVRDKSRSIAILRSMGLGRVSVMRIFLLSGAMIGFFGTALGLGLGVSVARNIEKIRQSIEGFFQTKLFQADIYYLTHLPSKIDMVQVGVIVFMALALSFLAALYPAFRAGKMDPIDILRHE